MARSVGTIENEIASLKAELSSVQPAEALSVRELAQRAGISPATAHRFKSGKAVDIPTARKLMDAGLITVCPCCGKGGGEDGSSI